MMGRIRQLLSPRKIWGTIKDLPGYALGMLQFTRDYIGQQPILGVLLGLAAVLFAVFFLMLGSLSPNSPGPRIGCCPM